MLSKHVLLFLPDCYLSFPRRSHRCLLREVVLELNSRLPRVREKKCTRQRGLETPLQA